jgi:hypothetical protein
MLPSQYGFAMALIQTDDNNNDPWPDFELLPCVLTAQ